MWRRQRARESIITYRYELAPDTAWYLPMRLHLLWCDASIPNDICYAISVRFIFPTLTTTSHSLYLHIGSRKDSLFSQCWSFELWAFRTLGKHAPRSYNPRFPGEVWMFSTGDWTLHSPVHCPGKTENWNYFCCLPQGQLLKTGVSRLWVPCGDWRNSWQRDGIQTSPHLKYVLPTYTSASSIEINSTIHKSCN